MVYSKSFVTLNIAVFFLMSGVGTTVALLPQRVFQLSGSVLDVGMLAAVFAVPFLMAQLPIGKWSSQYGNQIILILGYACCGLSGLLFYFSESMSYLVVGRIVQGLGEAPVWALVPAILATRFPAEKGKAVGIYNASIHLGLAAGGVQGIFMSQIWKNNEGFLLFAGVGFLGCLLVFFFVRDTSPQGNFDSNKKISLRLDGLLNRVEQRMALMGVMAYGAGYGTLISLVPAFLLAERGYDQGKVSIFFFCFYLALGASQALAGPWSDRKGRKHVMVCGFFLASLGLAVFVSFEHSWVLVFAVLASFGFGVFCVASFTFLSESVSAEYRGIVSGAYYGFWGIGYFAGPLVLGTLTENLGFQQSFVAFSILLSAIALAIGFLPWARHQKRYATCMDRKSL